MKSLAPSPLETRLDVFPFRTNTDYPTSELFIFLASPDREKESLYLTGQ